jgi:hypothetical protein
MGEIIQPTPEQAEAAFAEALSRPNPILVFHKNAHEWQIQMNGYAKNSDEPISEIVKSITSITDTLDKECGHMEKEIIISGRYKKRSINPNEITIGEAVDESLVDETWETGQEIHARSLGYFAYVSSERDVEIYHGASSEPEILARDVHYGAVHRYSRYLVPVDGTTHVELAEPMEEANLRLLRYYVPEELLATIDHAVDEGNMTSALRELGKIDLKKYNAVILDEDVRFALAEYVNFELDLDKQDNLDYQISGAQSVYVRNSKRKWTRQSINPNVLMTGSIKGIRIDSKNGRFRLSTRMPFHDNTNKDVLYQINDRLTVNELPSFTMGNQLRIHHP